MYFFQGKLISILPFEKSLPGLGIMVWIRSQGGDKEFLTIELGVLRLLGILCVKVVFVGAERKVNRVEKANTFKNLTSSL